MKNNKILYLLTILITLFSFNMKANAAQELTCVYKKNSSAEYKVALVQDSNGKQMVYINSEDEAVNGTNWESSNGLKFKILNYNSETNISIPINEITECPKKLKHDTNTSLIFSNEFSYYSSTDTELEDNGEYKGIKIAEKLDIKNYDGATSNLTCEAMKNLPKGLMLTELDTSKYDMSCIYTFDVNASYTVIDNSYTGGKVASINGCHIIQLNIGTKGFLSVSHSLPHISDTTFKNQFTTTLNYEDVKKNMEDNNGECPKSIYVQNIFIENKTQTTPTQPGGYLENKESVTGSTGSISSAGGTIQTIVTINETTGYDKYPLNISFGYNWITNESTSYDVKNNTGNIINILDCADLFSGDEGKDLLEILRKCVNLIKIGVPILLIVIGIIDFAKAIFSSKEDEMKKAQEKFIKRIILGVCIFLIPTVISYILEIYNLVWDKNISTDFCGILG